MLFQYIRNIINIFSITVALYPYYLYFSKVFERLVFVLFSIFDFMIESNLLSSTQSIFNSSMTEVPII